MTSVPCDYYVWAACVARMKARHEEIQKCSVKGRPARVDVSWVHLAQGQTGDGLL
jgi:hypothetical protein